ncbi:small ribosomal subunit protein uS11m [Gastrolobium bilobum]|uniref:small ribosomal subunit protein uS11m n=1 Tax=Gastrolobium bilobum TaxID=150636 RepID=UPI002AB18789|nr:small ribosomal subunit protein uS11m [Gastrolobium bilobum]
MYRYFSSFRHGRGSSLITLLAPKSSLPSNLQSHRFTWLPQNDGHVRRFSSSNWGWSGRNPSQNVNANARPDYMRDRENINSRSALSQNVNANANVRLDQMRDGENINSKSDNDAETGKNSRPMDFVRGIIEEDRKDFMGGSPYHYEQDADFVHIKMLRNNTFVTVTDSKGNIKLRGSAGSSLKDMKAGQKLSRYAAEATAEVVGRKARALGLKSVVMKVKGFTHFRRKRQAIMSWREGFTDSRGDRNPIVYIEDTTRRPHNGCRLPKKRRI